jgi:hypothetical protein
VSMYAGPYAHLTALQRRVIELREWKKKGWAQIAKALDLPGKSPEVKRVYASRLYRRAKATIEERRIAESQVADIEKYGMRPSGVQRAAQRFIRRQGELHVEKLPPRQKWPKPVQQRSLSSRR